MNGQVSLTSDAHNTQLVQTFGDLFMNKILTDVTLLCEDRFKIEAHKVVLCAGSNFFREFFTTNTNDNLILYMRGIPKHHLMPLIQFLYCGETTVPNKQVQEILNVAKELEITTLDEDKLKEENEPNCEVNQKPNLDMIKDSNSVEEDTSNDIFHSNFASSISELSCENCSFVGLNKESIEKHKKLTHRDKVTTMSTFLDLDKSGLTRKKLPEDGHNIQDDEYIEPALVLKQAPRSPYWPFFKFLKTKDNSKTIHCMPCLESNDVRMRKKEIGYGGGTACIKYHMERYHKDLMGTNKDLIGPSLINPMDVNSQQSFVLQYT